MTKLGFLADLHFSGTTIYLEKIAHYLFNKLELDYLVLGGDSAASPEGLEKILKIFSKYIPANKILLVVGNHDLWVNNSEYKNSYEIYTKVFVNLCSRTGVTYLEDTSIILDMTTQEKWGIVGSIAWYDYSAKYPGLPLPDDYYAFNKRKYNNDGNFIKLIKNKKELSDIEFSVELLKKFKINVEKIYNTVNNLIVATHVPIFSSSIKYREHKGVGADWNTGSAYFYNLTFGTYIKTLKKVKLVLSGHTHLGYEGQIVGENSVITELISASDYGHPEITVVSIAEDNKISMSRKFIHNYIL